MPSLFGLAGAAVSDNILSNTNADISGLTTFRPGQFTGPGGFGISTQGNVSEGQDQQLLRQMIGQGGANLLGGGLFNDPNFQNAFQQNDIGGTFGQTQQGLQQGIGPQAFGGLQGLFNQNAGLSQMFAQQTAQGPQDVSGGAMGGLFGAGFNAINQAGNLGGLIQQNLNASNALAAPGESRLINSFNNQEFARTGSVLGSRGPTTSGAFDRQGQLQDSLLRSQNQRVLGAQGLGLQAQQQLGQFGLGATQQGAGLLGQSLGQFNQGGLFANQFGQAAGGFEGQGFGQGLASLQQNQSAGQQRLQNSLGLFGLGNDTFGQNFQLGLGAQGSLTERDSLFSNLFLGQQNAAANRVGSTGLHAGALADNAAARAASIQAATGGGFGDFFG